MFPSSITLGKLSSLPVDCSILTEAYPMLKLEHPFRMMRPQVLFALFAWRRAESRKGDLSIRKARPDDRSMPGRNRLRARSPSLWDPSTPSTTSEQRRPQRLWRRPGAPWGASRSSSCRWQPFRDGSARLASLPTGTIDPVSSWPMKVMPREGSIAVMLPRRFQAAFQGSGLENPWFRSP